MDLQLNNKTALVTGAASGIGEAVAKALAHAGAFVYVADVDAVNGAGLHLAHDPAQEGRAAGGCAAVAS